MENFNYVLKDECYAIVGAAMEVHKELRGGLLEAIYHEALILELTDRGVPFESEKELDVFYKGKKLQKKYFADLVCYGDIIVEIKAVSELLPEHEAQIINYLKITKKKVGLLVNFGGKELVWKRFVN